ncbi:MAG: 6-phosphogluconolactonase [Clostridiales bacterium]|jgi:glucosamine-6-phosphate isomerase|nr:6-phosphogluconolactonase [Clostridiales bacterium]
MLKVYDTYELLCEAVTDEICKAISRNPQMLLCIAAGHTSLGVFKSLREALKSGKVDFSHAAFVAMDEWMDMSKKTPGSCGAFLYDEFLGHINFAPENIRLFDGTVSNREAECDSVEGFIASHGGSIDYLVLGSGMNGHLALNEPGTPMDSRAHVTALDPLTAAVGQKYFRKETTLTGGLTLGINDFAEAKRSVLMVTGSHKNGILNKILSNTISADIPATAVRNFKNASIYADRAAVEGIPVKNV